MALKPERDESKVLNSSCLRRVPRGELILTTCFQTARLTSGAPF